MDLCASGAVISIRGGPAQANEDPIAAAIESASELGHSYVDTAHLLLGLVRGQSRIGKCLRADGVSYGPLTMPVAA